MITPITDLPALQRAERTWIAAPGFTPSDHLATVLDTIGGNPNTFPRLADLGEVLFANRAELSAAARVLCGQIAMYMTDPGGGAFGYGASDRGLKILAGMEWDMAGGEGVDPAAAVEPRAVWAVPAEPDPAPAPE